METQAKTITQCDNCKKSLEKDEKGKSIKAVLDDHHAKKTGNFHYCDEECLRQHLNSRSKRKKSRASLELEISKTSVSSDMNISDAKHTCACDECGAAIGELYPNNKNNISIPLSKPSKTNKGDSMTEHNDCCKDHHFCDETCLNNHLNKRAKSRAKAAKLAKANVLGEDGILILEIERRKK